jgi:hypothetical protein
MSKTWIASLGRIADFGSSSFASEKINPEAWESGDYVVGKVVGKSTGLYHIEDTAGTMHNVKAGDRIVGAFGTRAATLEGVGSWRDIRDGHMHAMTSAGLIGAFTSLSTFLPAPLALEYSGHVVRNGRKLQMRDFAITTRHPRFARPTVLLVGTSMSAGKTETGTRVVSDLSSRGLNIIGAKLTGAGRYRDILAFKAAGATAILDFVDAGLPSTITDEARFRNAIRQVLFAIDEREPDFLVAEAGASPLEPYNGAAAIDELGNNICCTILCASDPYAVLGVQTAFGLDADLVSGPATTTSAGRDLVTRLTGVPACNILDPESAQTFRQILHEKLGL